MPRQSLRLREIVIVVEGMQGKTTIYEARDILKSKGFIVTDENSINEWELDQARVAMESARRYRRRTKEIDLEPVNLFEEMPDGGRRHYYKKFGELTADEGAQLLGYWKDKVDQDAREFYRYYRPLKKTHGRKLTQKIWFDLPAKPMKAGV